MWQWQPDHVEGYSVCLAYQLLTSQQHAPLEVAEDPIWHKQIPLKVSLFSWRLLRDRLPTKENLVTRAIVTPAADHSCVSGCGGMESVQHLFISSSIWFSLAVGSIMDWFFGCGSLEHLGSLSSVYSFFGWSSCAALIFTAYLALMCFGHLERTKSTVIRNSELSLTQLLEKVKLYSYWWLKTTNITLVSSCLRWWSSLFTCLGIDRLYYYFVSSLDVL
jgi:hypothetical protein